MIKRLLVLGCSLLLTTSVVACGSAGRADIIASADSAVPADSVQDWATYADAIAVIDVLNEERIPPGDDELKRGEGTVSRRITIGIEKPLWLRPTARDDIRLPSELVTGGGFWEFRGDKEARVRVENREWLEVGGKYLAIMAYIDPEFSVNPEKKLGDADPQWGPLVWMAYRDGRIDSLFGDESGKELLGLTGEELARMMESTKPDPDAAPYMREDPALRYQHAMQGK